MAEFELPSLPRVVMLSLQSILRGANVQPATFAMRKILRDQKSLRMTPSLCGLPTLSDDQGVRGPFDFPQPIAMFTPATRDTRRAS
jgi:hypothetical protein